MAVSCNARRPVTWSAAAASSAALTRAAEFGSLLFSGCANSAFFLGAPRRPRRGTRPRADAEITPQLGGEVTSRQLFFDECDGRERMAGVGGLLGIQVPGAQLRAPIELGMQEAVQLLAKVAFAPPRSRAGY